MADPRSTAVLGNVVFGLAVIVLLVVAVHRPRGRPAEVGPRVA